MTPRLSWGVVSRERMETDDSWKGYLKGKVGLAVTLNVLNQF